MTDVDWPFGLVLVGTPDQSSLLCEDLGSDLVTLVTLFVPSLATKSKVDGRNVWGEGLNQQKQHAKALDFRVFHWDSGLFHAPEQITEGMGRH